MNTSVLRPAWPYNNTYSFFCHRVRIHNQAKGYILCFASAAEKKTLLGWEDGKQPMLMFIDSRQPSEDGKLPLLESTLPQAHTCGSTILLLMHCFLSWLHPFQRRNNDWNNLLTANLAGLIGHNDKIYILLKLISGPAKVAKSASKESLMATLC
jgi:hypothetical protein